MSRFDVKLVIVGECGCGKSSLLQRLVSGRFHADLPPTYGTEFAAKKVEVEAPDGSARRLRVSVGVWDTSGAPRFHSLTRRFLGGADAILVCWDATNRASWDSLRAWVLAARCEEPRALIFLAATKADQVQVPVDSLPGASSAPVAASPHASARLLSGSSSRDQLDLGVSVDHWQGGSSSGGGRGTGPAPPGTRQVHWQPSGAAALDDAPDSGQGQQQEQQATAEAGEQQGQHAGGQAGQQQGQQVEGEAGKPPLPSGTPSGGFQGEVDAALPAAPTTPLQAAQRPQSPAEHAAPEGSAAGTPGAAGAAAGAAAAQQPAAQRILVEHESAAAAEVLASLTGQDLLNPFAAAQQAQQDALRKLAPAGPSPEPSPASEGNTAGSRAPSSAMLGLTPSASPRSGALHADDWERGQQAQQAQRGSSSNGRGSGSSSEGQQQELASLPPPAVPLAAIEQYCQSLGGTAGRLLWLSARSGSGVAAGFSWIAQEVVAHRWQQRRWMYTQQTQQQAQQQEAPLGRTPAPRRTATAAPYPAGDLPDTPSLPLQRQRPRSADGGGQTFRHTASIAAGAGAPGNVGRADGGGHRARSASPSPSPCSPPWLHEYSFDGGRMGGGRRRPAEQESCRIS